MRDTEREAETQAEGEAGSMQGPQCGTQSQNPGITPRSEGRCSTTKPPRHPCLFTTLTKNYTPLYALSFRQHKHLKNFK